VEPNILKQTILRVMYTKNYIGKKHTHVEKILKPIKDKDPKKIFDELVKENLIIPHKTYHGDQYSLNHHRIKEIWDIIKPS
jgi:hypothetical protein